MSAARKLDPELEKIFELTTPADLSRGFCTGESLDNASLLRLVTEQKLKHIVQKDGFRFDREHLAGQIMLANPELFLRDPLEVICGVNSNLPADARRFQFNCPAHTNNSDMLDALNDFISQGSNTRRISDRAVLIADELYTNASKNSWLKSVPLHLRDSNESPVSHHGAVEIFAHADSEKMVLGCRDSFGKLDLKSVLGRMRKCYENGVVDSIRRGEQGAGIGSYLVFESSASYYAAVRRNQTTVVCSVLALGAYLRQSTELPKNIHLLDLPELSLE